MFNLSRWGIHPDYQKEYTAAKPIEIPTLPVKVIIPLRQHIGASCSSLVNKGDLVKKGQIIASSDAAVSSNIHASISGKVIDVADYPHAVFGECASIVIESDGLDEWIDGIPLSRNWESQSVQEILQIIKEAGIVGLGGATFPTHIKLSPPKDKKIDTFILNAAECEPFLTADHRMMLEYTQRIVTGVKIVMKVLNVDKCYVGVEDNKQDAIIVMREAFKDTEVKIAILPTKYPQGAEKMLIKSITGKEVPAGKLPMDVGVVVQNVGTVIAIFDAVTKGIPMIERVVTISGSCIKTPKNLLLRVGTTFSDAIELCGGLTKPCEKVVMGGPMMGVTQHTTDVPVIKGTSGILCLGKDDVNASKESACIRCGKCINVCPMDLNPSMLGILGEKKLFEEAKEEYNLLDCVECGCCSYNCPSKRRNVQYIRYCKKLYMDNAAKKKGGAK